MHKRKAPKRMRGWELERAKGDLCQKDPLEEITADNPLCTRLLELWSQGKLAACQVAEICHLAMLSGSEHSEILAMAKCGNFGQHSSNAHRDMLSLYCKELRIAEPHMVEVPVKDPKTQKAGTEYVPILLPHLVFSTLSHNYEDVFEEMFAIPQCAAFWKSTEKLKDPRLIPPLTLTKGKVDKPEKTVPIFIHGDGCEYQSRDTLMTWSWGSLLSMHASLSSHLLLTAVPKACTIPGTWPALDEWICWSFAALTKGMHPEVDPWNGPLPKGPMAELAGQPLTKGLHRGAIFSIQGDQEFISNVLKMPHWMNKHPCAECDCQRPVYKKELAPPGKSTKILKSEEQTYHFKTVEESVLDKKTDHPLFSLDGITPLHVRGDSLHILFSRGVANHLSGSLIHYVIYFDWPRRQKISANNRLQTLFARIKELYSEASVSARLTHLRLSMICDATKPFKGYPCLEAKAAETKHFLPCLESVLNEILDPAEDPIHITMKEAIHAFNQAVRHYDNMDAFLTATEYATGQNFVKRFFDAYQDLNSWALAKGRKLFHITHKFHSALHLFKNTKFLNYRMHHNFRAEDYVGRISQLAHSCSFGVKSSRAPAKLMEKYRILLHLQLVKPGFGFSEQVIEP